MINRFLLSFYLLIAVFSFSQVKAAHIAGAELIYECIGNSDYRVKLIMYRDCAGGGAQFDNPVDLYIFDLDNGNFTTVSLPRPGSTPQITPPNWGACTAQPYNLCLQVGTYNGTVNLPPNANGYDIGWARCCRNNNISNLADPRCEGVTFLAHVPSVAIAACNSMPTFKQNPSLFLCAGEQFFFDYSAIDTDGDSLAYEISNPYTGENMQNQGTGNPNGCNTNLPPALGGGNNMGLGPYRNVTFAPGHSFTNPFGPGSNITINPNTGYLSAFPANPGIYVLAVSVKEYRNGVLLSENKRDFQFHVINCLPQGPPPILTHTFSGLNTSNDTIFVEGARPFCYDIFANDTVTPSHLVVTPISIAFGGNGGFPPPYATVNTNGFAPPVLGQVCWVPNCDYIGRTVEMVISVRDTSDCPNYNLVFDTVYVTVQPSPNIPPLLQYDISSLQTTPVGDTIVLDVEENFCFPFQVIDTLGGAALFEETEIQTLSGNPVGQSQIVNSTISGDTLSATFCWDPGCNFDEVFMVILTGIDEYQCPPQNRTEDTLYIKVNPPANPAPTTNLLAPTPGQPTNGDTVIIRVHEQYCNDFVVVDTSIAGADSLFFSFSLTDLNGGFAGQQPNYLGIINGDSLAGNICWTPRCVNVDQYYRLIVEGTQQNYCGIRNSTDDTIYFRVIEPFKPAPDISHDLGPGSPDNISLTIQDDESFCYSFRLSDTLTPTFLSYSATVEMANGAPYNGPQPSLTFSTNLDTLVEGEICWEIPCEFANGSFRILMTGTDTFDCRSSNIVFDTVYINHIENIPDQPDFCTLSVGSDDLSIDLSWQPSIQSDIVGYVIYRKREDEPNFVAIDTFNTLGDTTYTDTQNIFADDWRYCYALAAIDRCGNVSSISAESCSILLEAEQGEYVSLLNWTAYSGWPAGVAEYEMYRSYPEANRDQEFLTAVPPTQLTLNDDNIDEAVICYRVRALDAGTGCGGESWSNEVCLRYPPTLYVPTAFTPNGDGLNEIFTSYGEFADQFDMSIYDRWGKLLFRTQDINAGWDGKVNGKVVPEGVYIYRMKVVGYDGTELTRNGSITVLR